MKLRTMAIRYVSSLADECDILFDYFHIEPDKLFNKLNETRVTYKLSELGGGIEKENESSV